MRRRGRVRAKAQALFCVSAERLLFSPWWLVILTFGFVIVAFVIKFVLLFFIAICKISEDGICTESKESFC